MSNTQKRAEPKKIKMPPLVDRSMWYDTMSWCELDTSKNKSEPNENYYENDSQSIPKLESDQTN